VVLINVTDIDKGTSAHIHGGDRKRKGQLLHCCLVQVILEQDIKQYLLEVLQEVDAHKSTT
jgi:hypothetical protein